MQLLARDTGRFQLRGKVREEEVVAGATVGLQVWLQAPILPKQEPIQIAALDELRNEANAPVDLPLVRAANGVELDPYPSFGEGLVVVRRGVEVRLPVAVAMTDDHSPSIDAFLHEEVEMR